MNLAFQDKNWEIFIEHYCYKISKVIALSSPNYCLVRRTLADPNPYLVSLDKKIEQELWNQCYKNPISQLQEQQKSKSARPEIRQEAAHNLTELLEGAYGFYLRLLDEICEVYSLEVPNRASDKQLKMINTLVPNRGTFSNTRWTPKWPKKAV